MPYELEFRGQECPLYLLIYMNCALSALDSLIITFPVNCPLHFTTTIFKGCYLIHMVQQCITCQFTHLLFQGLTMDIIIHKAGDWKLMYL